MEKNNSYLYLLHMYIILVRGCCKIKWFEVSEKYHKKGTFCVNSNLPFSYSPYFFLSFGEWYIFMLIKHPLQPLAFSQGSLDKHQWRQSSVYPRIKVKEIDLSFLAENFWGNSHVSQDIILWSSAFKNNPVI